MSKHCSVGIQWKVSKRVHGRAVTVVWATVMAMEDGRFIRITVLEGEACQWGSRLKCSVSPTVWGVAMGTYACVAAYFILYFWLLWRGSVQLRAVTYQKYRMANLVHRLQVRQRAADLRRMHASAEPRCGHIASTAVLDRRHELPALELSQTGRGKVTCPISVGRTCRHW